MYPNGLLVARPSSPPRSILHRQSPPLSDPHFLRAPPTNNGRDERPLFLSACYKRSHLNLLSLYNSFFWNCLGLQSAELMLGPPRSAQPVPSPFFLKNLSSVAPRGNFWSRFPPLRANPNSWSVCGLRPSSRVSELVRRGLLLRPPVRPAPLTPFLCGLLLLLCSPSR